ncbi:MAG TPA: hypothetical protein VIW07_09080, partial [Candidatus Udaeobacter sp.]
LIYHEGYEAHKNFVSRILPPDFGRFCNYSAFVPVILFMGVSNRLKFVEAGLSLFCLGCALSISACANDDSSNDSSQHHRHHGGSAGGRNYGHGQGGPFDRSNASGSQPPVPGE